MQRVIVMMHKIKSVPLAKMNLFARAYDIYSIQTQTSYQLKVFRPLDLCFPKDASSMLGGC